MDTIRRAVRSLRRSPGYTATAIGSIAVGLALATATFAFVRTVTQPSVWFPDPERIFYERLRFGDPRNRPSAGDRVALLRTLPGIEHLAVVRPARLGEIELSRMRYATTQAVTPEYWSIYPIRPVLGRMPTEQDIVEGRSILVSEQLWKQEFPAGAGLKDAKLRIGDRNFDVIGVLPIVMQRTSGVDVWLTSRTGAELDSRASAIVASTSVILKFRPGYSPERLRADLDRIVASLNTSYPTGRAPKFQLQLQSVVPRRATIESMEILLYVLGFGILAIGCTNVAALTLARGLMRRRDYALRMALGASRTSVAKTVVGEVALVTLAGGALGLGVAYGLIGLLRRATPTDLLWRGLSLPDFSAPVFGYSLIAMLAAVIMGGALPAWRATRIAPNEPLKDGAGTTTGRGGREFRLLVIGELAIAMVLLMMASLVTLSLRNIAQYDFGFAARSVVSASVSPRTTAAANSSPAARRALRLRSLEVFASTPGVRSAAIMGGGRNVPGKQIISDGSAAGEPILEASYSFTAGPGFFTALGIAVKQGRDFEEGDMATNAAILSERAAAILFPRGDALGRSVKIGGLDQPGTFARVVGISEEFQFQPAEDPADRDPPVFLIAADTAPMGWQIIGLASTTPAAATLPIQNHLRDALPPGWRVTARSFVEQLEMMYSVLGYFTKIFGVLGFAALGLGALGVFSVLSYVVRQREREFAVRVALGATQGNLIRVVMRNAFEFALGGTAIGALLSFGASAGVSTFLFGVKNTDPVSLIVTEFLLVAVTLLAALAPALRASRANPLDIIRAV